ncbi:hypothetical protein CC1G_09317 [Coprinopsis cinerea okayama7|uniref:Phospholipid/glycerol acyltransferase domain-containing protein n=1 Tax=Coprinopsis cinerea (strain Okayama-7 / 130 / ATCC MYA-4618 / FGSC 9003) TaxID=240176 RepID=A8N5L2_COPC7|nr:hypothetical protein CC1G_09317 [Coprinopsis cinerea okayama7\|eukprot:XP_001830157.2 hypothetical protein CC1G_09317 [Coprinopsis cinerea okayama7\
MAPPPQGEDFMLLHRIIRFLAYLSSHSFFHEIRVIGEENVPKDGPIIVLRAEPLAAQLFKNPAVAWILYSSGNIPVDRKSKDRQRLFDGTFKALAKGNAVALFPEGTSYTEPRIMQVKDGAAWAALEYYKYKEAHPELADQPDVKIVPAAIVYTNKSKYRSSVVVEYGKPISAADFKEQFLSTEENAPRSAVKCLTRTLESELVESTINAPDWDTLYAARMAKDLLWEGDRSVGLDNFVPVSQTLVDLFSNPDIVPNFNSVRRHLLTYYSLLQSSHLTNGVLSSLPLPRSLDPNTPTTTPGRLFTLLILVRDSITALIGLPFFFLPLIVHLPVYMMGRMGARLVEDEEETQAQNKVALGLITSLLLYPAVFFFLWALFWYTPIGAILAGSLVYLFAFYHTKMIDGNYERAKRFVAAWRVLVGVWTPKRFDLSMGALSQFMTPKTPPPNPWIDKARVSPKNEESKEGALERSTSLTDLKLQQEPPVKSRSARRPPSRRLVRHVLRARVEAINALASMFDQLENHSDKRVKSSLHLAKLYGETVSPAQSHSDSKGIDGIPDPEQVQGYRSVKEIIRFLKERGANIPTLRHGRFEEQWAAATSSDAEGYSTTEEK